MYVVIAEDKSDLECLKVLIRRLANDKTITIEGKGYHGCGDMLKNGALLLRSYGKQKNFRKFIVCYDRDEESSQKRYEQVISEIIKPAGIKKSENLICILIPTKEIEAWILADTQAISKVFSSWKAEEEFLHPETIDNPKEKLVGLINKGRARPLYTDSSNNKPIMNYLNLDIVKKKCPSFAELAAFVEQNKPNYPVKDSIHI
jgi:hypothetical protein